MSQILASRSRRFFAAAISALVMTAGAAPALAQDEDHTIEAYGQATVRPTPKHQTNASIAKAVRDAVLKALPLAIADAKQQASDLATAAGVTLGELLSISNVPPQTPPFYGPFLGEQGTFGRGKFCGDITFVHRVKTKSGKFRIVRHRRHTCRVPEVTRQVELRYAIAP